MSTLRASIFYALVALLSSYAICFPVGSDHSIEDPLFAIDVLETLGGLVLVQPPHTSQFGMVCVVDEPSCVGAAQVLCTNETIGRCAWNTTASDSLRNDPQHRFPIATTSLQCDPALHTYVSLCPQELAQPDPNAVANVCPGGQQPLRVQCVPPTLQESAIGQGRVQHRAALALSDSATSAVLVYSRDTSESALSSRFAGALAVSEQRVSVQRYHQYGAFYYGLLAFKDASSELDAPPQGELRRVAAPLGEGETGESGITTTAAPTTTTTTAAPTTTTTTAAPTTTTTTAAPTTTTATAAPTTTTTTASPTTTTTTPAPTTTPAQTFTSSPFTTGVPSTNDDLPPETLLELASIIPVSTLAEWGVFEIRSAVATARCANESLSGSDNVITCLQGPNVSSPSSSSSWFTSKMAVYYPANNLTGTVCGSGWTDAHATAACLKKSPMYRRGFVILMFDDTSHNEWPILAELKDDGGEDGNHNSSHTTTGIVFSTCESKRNNCTHANDVGALCSQGWGRPTDVETVRHRFTLVLRPGLEMAEWAALLEHVIPSSAGRINGTVVQTTAPPASSSGNATAGRTISFTFTSQCDNSRLPTRGELEQMFFHLNGAGVEQMGVLEVHSSAEELDELAVVCPFSSSTSISVSRSASTVAVFMRIHPLANITNITHTFQRLLAHPGPLPSVRLSPTACVIYFSAASLALGAVELVEGGFVSEVFSASFLEPTDSSSSDHDRSDGPQVVVIIAALGGSFVLVAVVVLLVKHFCCGGNSKSSSSTTAGAAKSLTVLDAEMNTLFLPINLDDLEEWDPSKRQ